MFVVTLAPCMATARCVDPEVVDVKNCVNFCDSSFLVVLAYCCKWSGVGSLMASLWAVAPLLCSLTVGWFVRGLLGGGSKALEWVCADLSLLPRALLSISPTWSVEFADRLLCRSLDVVACLLLRIRRLLSGLSMFPNLVTYEVLIFYVYWIFLLNFLLYVHCCKLKSSYFQGNGCSPQFLLLNFIN